LTDLELLTSAEAGVLASKVAVFGGVRAALRAYQRDLAHRRRRGARRARHRHVICPDADVKLFIEADSRPAWSGGPPTRTKGLPVDRYALITNEERDARRPRQPQWRLLSAPMPTADTPVWI